jgi:hypothetical protein
MAFILGLFLFVVVGGILDSRIPWRDGTPRQH